MDLRFLVQQSGPGKTAGTVSTDNHMVVQDDPEFIHELLKLACQPDICLGRSRGLARMIVSDHCAGCVQPQQAGNHFSWIYGDLTDRTFRDDTRV